MDNDQTDVYIYRADDLDLLESTKFMENGDVFLNGIEGVDADERAIFRSSRQVTLIFTDF